jgi:hypothetical protein
MPIVQLTGDHRLAPPQERSWVRRYRLVIWFAVALAGIDGLVAANSRFLNAYDPHPYQERLARCAEGDWDVIIAGGSPAMCGVDPAILRGATWHDRELKSAYNLGLPLATATEICLAVEHALPRPPSLLIYCVSATDLNECRVEPHAPRQIMNATDVGRLATQRPKDAGWCARNYLAERANHLWQLYCHRGAIRLWAAEFVNRIWPDCCEDAAATARMGLAISSDLRQGFGYRSSPAETPTTRLDQRKAVGERFDHLLFMEPYRLGGRQLLYFRRLLDWGAENAVPIVLVEMPVSADLDERLYPAEYGSFRATLAALATSRNLPLLRPTRADVGLTDGDFVDLIHLNASGASRLSHWLRAALDHGESLFMAAENEP